jgi:hypothetical protein
MPALVVLRTALKFLSAHLSLAKDPQSTPTPFVNCFEPILLTFEIAEKNYFKIFFVNIISDLNGSLNSKNKTIFHSGE